MSAPPTPAQWVEMRPLGAELDTVGTGTSMAPLLRAGDVLRVRRSGEAELRRGDLALLVREDGALVVHVVRRTQPLVTSSFLGVTDTEELRVLGVVIRVTRAGRSLSWPRWVSPLTLAASEAAARARRHPRLWSALSRVRALVQR